jgi:N-acetylglucosamine kinase-like BadF-type ATPase
VIAIESGGSGTRIALAGPGGAFVRLERCASGSCLYRDPAGFASGFNEALGRVLAVTTAQRHTIRAVGMAGPMDEPLVRGLLNGALPGVPQYTYSEGEVARGLYGIRAGIALIAGTGCSCSAVDEAGVLTSFGGYGPQFGDEGSAYWIGQEGLKTAFLAEQGRIEPTALLDAARAFYDVASPWGIHEEAGGRAMCRHRAWRPSRPKWTVVLATATVVQCTFWMRQAPTWASSFSIPRPARGSVQRRFRW